MTAIKIGTRCSPLALQQAHEVQEKLRALYPEVHISIIEIMTQGDKTLDVPLSEKGGKGLFLKELEHALLAGEIDLAVHSMKDVPVKLPKGLSIPVICKRESPFDVLVSNQYKSLVEIPPNKSIGTCSLRRKCQIKNKFPSLNLVDLRGNINTRLKKLDRGEFVGIILAAAGLSRLGLNHLIKEKLDPAICLPAVGQGALGLECRANDEKTQKILTPLNHSKTFYEIQIERLVNDELDGGCHMPIAVYSQQLENTTKLSAMVGSIDGGKILSSSRTYLTSEHQKLVKDVVDDLFQQGAEKIINSIYGHK